MANSGRAPTAEPGAAAASGTTVVVGASLAGWRAAEALRAGGARGPIIVIGAEPHAPYDRPPLSKQVLTGRIDAGATRLERVVGLDIDWRLGTPAAGLDLDRGIVTLTGGDHVGFDSLVIATGSRARALPGLADLDGVHLLRTLDDAVALRAGLEAGGRIVIVGAGFIGLEVAASCRTLDLDVTVVETAAVPLERAVGAEIGGLIADWHRGHGVDLRLGAGVEGLVGSERVEGVRLRVGPRQAVETVAADLVVVGVGATPNTEWLDHSGVDIDNGVRTDSRLRVLADGRALAHVVAAGDIARWDHVDGDGPVRVEHWTNAVEQAEAAAATLLNGDDAAPFAPVPYFWSDQYDRKVQMVGLAR
ncbi:MAG TPA: FAD-dependent oxidoreductase, partial [Acidimicrobiales bacterium]